MINLDEKLAGIQSVGISGHVKPDGDCVGSTLAVYNYIRTYYPHITVELYLELIPDVFQFLQNADKINHDTTGEQQFDLFIALDCGDAGRLGGNARYFENAKQTLCIDHHISNQAFADDNYVIPDASSTCELVYDIIDADKITKEIAECLYTGMVHDTGVFQYSCTSKKTMNIAGILKEKGIDSSRIIDETFYQKTYKQNLILGRAILDSKLYLDGKCILTCLTQKTMEEYGCTTRDLEGIVNQLRVTKGTLVAAFLYENVDGAFKVSLRANEEFNVADVAAQFGGGGHVKAAGCTMEGSIEEIIHKLIETIQKQL